MGDVPRLDPEQRSCLLQDFREDLDDQVEDAEERGITERGARDWGKDSLLSAMRRRIRS
jgi:hypothetical protein